MSKNLSTDRRWEFLAATIDCRSIKEMMELLDVSAPTIRVAARNLNIKIPINPTIPVRNQERRDLIIKLREEGMTYKSIGNAIGISYQRVSQILKSEGRFDLCYDSLAKRRKNYTD